MAISRPLHVCYLCDEYPPAPHGGIGVFTRTLGRALVQRGHAVSVVGVNRVGEGGGTERVDDGVRVVRVPHTRIRGLGTSVHRARVGAALSTIHVGSPIDVIEGPELSLDLVPRAIEIPTLIRMHGGHHFHAAAEGRAVRPRTARSERRSFQRADALCAPSRFVAERTARLLALPGAADIPVIANPVDLDRFRPTPARHDGTEREAHIVFVGTVCPQKGVPELLQAAALVADRHPTLRLSLIGRDWPDEEGGSTTARLRGTLPEGIAGRVTFRGPLPHERIPAALAEATIVVVPSHTEAFGLVIAEAMAAGRPVVAARAGAAAELISHGVDGLLCDARSASALAHALRSVLDDPEAGRRMGRAARSTAEKRFDLAHLVERNEALYRDLVEGGLRGD